MSEGGRFRSGSGATLCGELLFGADKVEERTASSEGWGQEPSNGKDGTPKDDGVNKNPAESGEAKQSARRRRKKERQKVKTLAARGGRRRRSLPRT